VEVMPKAIPIAPSTSCAKNPATETSSKTHMSSNLFDGYFYTQLRRLRVCLDFTFIEAL
jgi:hypothetical protein